MPLNRRRGTGRNRPVEELRHRTPYKKFGLLLALVAVFSVMPVPGMEFSPVASASERSFGSLERVSDQMSGPVSNPATDPGPDRVVRGEESIDPFTLIALTYQAAPSGPVMVRVHSDGAWSDWSELHLEEGAGPDERSREAAGANAAAVAPFSSEPKFVGSADGYQISIGNESEPGTHVVLVRESLGRVVADTTQPAGAATPLIPAMRDRSAWGARAPKSTPRYATSVQLAVIHHSESSNAYTPDQVPSALRSIQAFHMDSRGWDDIAYNFIVDKYGGIWEGRGGGADKAVVGAHATGFNTGTVGVMVLGSYTDTAPSAASIESVAHVVGWKFATFGVSPAGRTNFTSGGGPRYAEGQVVNLARVVGHGDVGMTTCPGLIRNYLSTIQARSIDYFRWYDALMSPEGSLDSAVGGAGTVTMSGWANDVAAGGPAWIRASAGAVSASFYTGLPRPDVQATKGLGPTTGWAGTLRNVAPGMQLACAMVQGATGNNTSLGCQWVLVEDPTGRSPVGRFDYVVTTPGEIHLQGWALDPDSSSTVRYDVLVDDQVRWTSYADQGSDSVPAQYKASFGVNRRFKARIPAVVGGSHNVCIRAYNYNAGVNTSVDCRLVSVPAHVPGGVIESVGSSLKNRLDLTGWALDLETAAPVDIKVIVGSRSYIIPADRPRADIAALYPGYGERHGFATTLYADGGKQPYCVYAVNYGGGSDGLLGCGTANIVK